MYRLLALDMDGTLLTSKKTITTEVRSEMKRLMNNDVDIMIATGRFPASVLLHAKSLGLTCPSAALNGAVILDVTTGETIDTSPLHFYEAHKIAAFAELEDVYVHFYGDNVLYVKEINDINRKWDLANVVVDETKPLTTENYHEQLSHFRIQEVGKLSSFLMTDQAAIYKAAIIADDPEKIDKLYEEMIQWPELCITRTGKRRFDINAANVSKKTALIKICKLRNIVQQQVVAVGDFDNDAEMIEWAGLGVAMANGNTYIKEIADTLTVSNDENGVAAVMQNYFK